MTSLEDVDFLETFANFYLCVIDTEGFYGDGFRLITNNEQVGMFTDSDFRDWNWSEEGEWDDTHNICHRHNVISYRIFSIFKKFKLIENYLDWGIDKYFFTDQGHEIAKETIDLAEHSDTKYSEIQ